MKRGVADGEGASERAVAMETVALVGWIVEVACAYQNS